LATYFSESLLRSLGLAIPFQAEYEGSIPFTRSNLLNHLEIRDSERGCDPAPGSDPAMTNRLNALQRRSAFGPGTEQYWWRDVAERDLEAEVAFLFV
jgi:hypothetical protein